MCSVIAQHSATDVSMLRQLTVGLLAAVKPARAVVWVTVMSDCFHNCWCNASIVMNPLKFTEDFIRIDDINIVFHLE